MPLHEHPDSRVYYRERSAMLATRTKTRVRGGHLGVEIACHSKGWRTEAAS